MIDPRVGSRWRENKPGCMHERAHLEIQPRRFTDSPLHLPITSSLLEIHKQILNQLEDPVAEKVVVDIHAEIIRITHVGLLSQRHSLGHTGIGEDPFFVWMLGGRFEGSFFVRFLSPGSATAPMIP